MISPEAIFFSLTMCASQGVLNKDPYANPFGNSVCNVTSEVIMSGGEIQKGLDRANHMFIDPIPEDVKRVGSVGLLYYKQHLHFGLYRGLSIDMQFVRNPNNTEDVASQSIVYHYDF